MNPYTVVLCLVNDKNNIYIVLNFYDASYQLTMIGFAGHDS
jgi:hypothetical protein